MEKAKNWINEHPNLASWLFLATGFVAILAYTARDVGLVGSQWFWLIFITIMVAGLCVWIISWGDDEDDEA
jgi:hypothetical protein